MRILIFIFILGLIPSAVARPDGWSEMLDRHQQSIMKFRDASLEVKIDMLIPPLIALEPYKKKWSEREKNIYDDAQEILVNTPGHADYFEKSIVEVQKGIQGKLPGKEYQQSDLDWISRKLINLPSLENMQMLSGFLEEIPTHQQAAAWPPHIPTHHYYGQSAARIITNLIEDPPDAGIFDKQEWLAWREDVKSGRRTFRFKGGKQDYNFDGPVESNRNAVIRKTDSGHGLSSDHSNSGGSNFAMDSGSPEESTSVPRWIYYALGTFILLLILWQLRQWRLNKAIQ